MPHIHIGASQYYYQLVGQGEPLVLIAGFGCDHSFWDDIVKDLSPHFKILLFDNLGCGQTQANLPIWNIAQMAKDTALLLRALNIHHPYLVGHSMGGLIAQSLVYQFPQDVAKLILLNTSMMINQRALMALDNLLHLQRENISLQTVIEASLPWFFSAHFLENPLRIAQYIQRIKNNPHLPSLENQICQFKAVQEFDSSSWIAQVKAKTLVIASDRDIICPPKESEALAKKLHADLALLPGGHSSVIEVPQRVSEAVLTFLTGKCLQNVQRTVH